MNGTINFFGKLQTETALAIVIIIDSVAQLFFCNRMERKFQELSLSRIFLNTRSPGIVLTFPIFISSTLLSASFAHNLSISFCEGFKLSRSFSTSFAHISMGSEIAPSKSSLFFIMGASQLLHLSYYIMPPMLIEKSLARHPNRARRCIICHLPGEPRTPMG